MIELSSRVLLSIGQVILIVGTLDAFLSRQWDLLAVFVLAILVNTTLWLRHQARRVPATLRPDLARWLERQSQSSGEPTDDLLDRAVAWYRHGLFHPEVRPEVGTGSGTGDRPAP